MKKPINFESALKRLEEIVDDMENGGAELEKSLKMFEEGTKLAKYCSDKLEEAKKKVRILTKDGGKMEPEPFKDKYKSE
jgi:exodeoxyribonuclease VII small subunit